MDHVDPWRGPRRDHYTEAGMTGNEDRLSHNTGLATGFSQDLVDLGRPGRDPFATLSPGPE